DLETHPVQVVRLLKPTPVGEDGAAKEGVLPVEVDLDEFVEIPVEADVDHLGVIGPEVRVGQVAGEDLAAQSEIAEAGSQLEGPQTEMARAEVEGPERVDQRPVADRLTSHEVPGLDEIATHRDADGPRTGSPEGIILEPAIPGPEQG